MVIGGMAGAFFLDKPPGAGPKSGSQWLDLRLAGFVFARREPGAIFWPPTPRPRPRLQVRWREH